MAAHLHTSTHTKENNQRTHKQIYRKSICKFNGFGLSVYRFFCRTELLIECGNALCNIVCKTTIAYWGRAKRNNKSINANNPFPHCSITRNNSFFPRYLATHEPVEMLQSVQQLVQLESPKSVLERNLRSWTFSNDLILIEYFGSAWNF